MASGSTVRYEITTADTLGVRFALSPQCEAALSLRTLVEPDRFPLQRPWAAATRHALRQVDVGLLRSLSSARNHWPDFLTSPPTTLRPTIDDELDALAAHALGARRRHHPPLLRGRSP